MELLCYKATLECNAAVDQELATDTNSLKKYFYHNFPELEIVFDIDQPDINNYLIRPKMESYEQLEKKYTRKVWMYAMEGVVMMLLLFWGIIWVYRSLLSRLELNRMQNNFLLSITHELKTPLASIKLYLETLQKRTLSKEQSDTILVNAVSDVNRLRDLVDNILIAAQLDTKKYELNNTLIHMSEKLADCVNKFAQPRNLLHRITLHVQQDIYITTDQLALETILINLLSNAEKYTPADGKISITLKQHQDKIILTVADEGIGISEEDKKNLFNKFFRSGDEQTRKSKGTGLGLFIVKNLLNRMNGEISVRDNQPKGSIFEITFNT